MKYSERRFVTFEAYLSQLYHEPNVDAEKIYSAGFYQDGPMYFVGYYMHKALQDQYGDNYIKSLLDLPPSKFYLDYIALCRDNSKLPCFSANAEAIIQELDKVKL
jgi:hypothetical protein